MAKKFHLAREHFFSHLLAKHYCAEPKASILRYSDVCCLVSANWAMACARGMMQPKMLVMWVEILAVTLDGKELAKVVGNPPAPRKDFAIGVSIFQLKEPSKSFAVCFPCFYVRPQASSLELAIARHFAVLLLTLLLSVRSLASEIALFDELHL
jgi:hypothetical protein